jgi:hypothetical protein
VPDAAAVGGLADSGLVEASGTVAWRKKSTRWREEEDDSAC